MMGRFDSGELNKKFKHFIISYYPLIIITLFFLIFSIYWSYISIMKFYALNAAVWDLGVAMQTAWTFMTNPFQPYPNLILWVIFPVFIPKSFQLILIFQAVFITAGVFPLYFIAEHFLKSKVASMFLSLSFIIYPYLSGMYWFDFHYQALFPTLFFLGYLFYIKDDLRLSFIFFIFAGITRFPYIFFIVLMGYVLILENFYYYKFRKEMFNKKRFNFSIILFVLSFIVFILWLRASGVSLSYSAPYSAMAANAHFSGKAFYIFLDEKLFVVYILLIPLMLLPIFSKRFVLLMLPFAYVLFFSNYWAYMFPSFLHLQYGPLIVPFLFLGTVDVISNLKKRFKEPVLEGKRFLKLKKHLSDPAIRIASVILIITILFAIVYQPYGPLNRYSETNFDLKEKTSVNWTVYRDLENIVALIPNNDPYVLTQNNIPEIFPRPPIPYGPMVTGFTDFLTNITGNDHYINTSQGLLNARIDYVIADMDSLQYTSGYPSMYNFLSTFYSSGEYGIIGEASGIVLLEKNYSGPLKYYRHYNVMYNASELYAGQNVTIKDNSLYISNFKQNVSLFSTPSANIPPGIYEMNITLKSNFTDVIKVNASSFYTPQIFSKVISVGKNSSGWVNVTVKFYVYSFFLDIALNAYAVSMSSPLFIKDVSITELEPFPNINTAF